MSSDMKLNFSWEYITPTTPPPSESESESFAPQQFPDLIMANSEHILLPHAHHTAPDVKIQIFNTTYYLHSEVLSTASVIFKIPEDESDPNRDPNVVHDIKLFFHVEVDGKEGMRPSLVKGEKSIVEMEAQHATAAALHTENTLWFRYHPPSTRECGSVCTSKCACHQKNRDVVKDAFVYIFRAIYRQHIATDPFKPLFFYQLHQRVDLAKQLKCQAAVAPAVHREILNRPGWIQDDPVGFFLLSLDLKSRAIFNDALIHIMGTWNSYQDRLERTLTPDMKKHVWHLVEREHCKQKELVIKLVRTITHEGLLKTQRIGSEVLTVKFRRLFDPSLNDFEMAHRFLEFEKEFGLLTAKSRKAVSSIMDSRLRYAFKGVPWYFLWAEVGSDDFPW